MVDIPVSPALPPDLSSVVLQWMGSRRSEACENTDPLDLPQNFHFSGLGRVQEPAFLTGPAEDAAASDHTLRTAASLTRSRAPGS